MSFPYDETMAELCAWSAADAADRAFGPRPGGIRVIQMVASEARHTHAKDGACNILFSPRGTKNYRNARNLWNRAFTAGFNPEWA